MKKRIACALLAGLMVLSMAGCGNKPVKNPVPSDDPVKSAQPVDEARKHGPVKRPSKDIGKPDPEDIGTAGTEKPEDPDAPAITDVPSEAASPTWFDDSLQAYLNTDAGWAGKSYMVSPASFRAALCLAIEGADGMTESGLLSAAKFKSVDDMYDWYGSLLAAKKAFDAKAADLASRSKEYGDGSDPGMAFDIANALWDNASKPGGFLKEYTNAVADKFGAVADSSEAGDITKDVNDWCDEATHGMIKKISDDLSESSSVLANALYVKSAWIDEFYDGNTAPGDFVLADGSKKTMDFMNGTDRYLYYADQAGRRYAVFGLEGDIYLTVCLDPDARVQDMYGSAYNAEYARLDVKMPKLDLETTLESGDLCGYLDKNGAGLSLSDGADFSKMTDFPDGWHIDDVIQKTRLKTDEDGLEAAAVTAIVMADNAMAPDQEPPVEFHMDEPFSFMISKGLYTEGSQGIVLFFGRFAG